MAEITCFNIDKVDRFKDRLARLDLESYAQAFKAAGHERRLEILHLLNTERECCVCDLANTFDCPVPTISQYLKILKAAGLIRSRVDGKFMHYSLTDFGKNLINLTE